MNPWLKNAEAAELLGVDKRTIKGWMTRPATRNALVAVRHGKQWRIPRPANLDHWRDDTHRQLKKLDIQLTPGWKRRLRKITKANARAVLESYRLWLPAYLNALDRGPIKQKAIAEILSLRQAAFKILSQLPDGTKVDTVKSMFPNELRSCKFSENEILSIMSCWPEKVYLDKFRGGQTLKQLETIWRGIDFAQAAKTCEHLGKDPAAENLCPLLHQNIMEHINDTREELPGRVVQNPGSRKLHSTIMSRVCDAIRDRQPPLVCIDSRRPQDGLALRTFRARHPLRKSPQKEIIAEIYGHNTEWPCAHGRLETCKTPVRNSIET